MRGSKNRGRLPPIAKAAAALGVAAAKANRRRVKSTIQKRINSRRSGSLTSLPLRSLSGIKPTNSYSIVGSSGQSFKTHFEPLDADAVQLRTDHNGLLYIASGAATTYPTTSAVQDSNWDFHPVADSTPHLLHLRPFGDAISNLGASYTKYRIHSVTATYHGGNNLIQNLFTLGMFSDPALIIANYQQMQALQVKQNYPYAPLANPPSITFDFNKHYAMRGSTLPWMSMKRNNAALVSDLRQEYQGTLCVTPLDTPSYVSSSGTVTPIVDGVLGTIRLRGLIEFCELTPVQNSSSSSGLVSDSSAPTPSFTLEGQDTSATAAAPLASAITNAKLHIVSDLDLGMAVPDTSHIRFGQILAQPGNANYQLDMSWTNTVGVTAAPPVPAIINTGTGVLVITASASSALAPYDLSIQFNVSGTDGTSTNYCALTFTGPTGMTAGTCHAKVITY